MKKNSTISILCFGMFVLFLSSCVSMKKYNELKSKEDQCEKDNTNLKSQNMTLQTTVDEQTAAINDLKKRKEALENDTNVIGTSLRKENELYAQLNSTYNELLTAHDKLISGRNAENRKLIGQLQSTQEDLQIKEDKLNKLQIDLAKKEADLNNLNAELKEREQKLADLQNILAKKDSTVNALRNTVADALLGFKDKGMTVTMKNGKVYVSLEEQLLFATASTVVDQKGVEALKQLAKVLDKNPDINVLIEGHTDNVPFNGSGELKDNWDLSVMRATSVVRILTSNSKINPARLTAAGRSEYAPVDTENTVQARKKNRRIEIILTPKLDELFKVLETN
jgi:chemotaxis protein MotB